MDASTRPSCLSGTRTYIIEIIIGWVYLFPERRLFWLNGLAGSGKSTLSTTLANFFRERGLGAFIFFDRDVQERSYPPNVIRTMAYQLGSFDNRIGAAIRTAFKNIPSIADSPLRLQFRKLIIEPISSLSTTGAEEPIIIILDGLDECGDVESRKELLSLLSAETVYLPSYIRVLITSRDEFDIRTAFMTKSHVMVHELDIMSDDNTQDILSFFRFQMAEISAKNFSLSLEPNWPGDAAINKLVARAAGLFVWASTACRFIDGHDPRKCLEVLLKGDVSDTADCTRYAIHCRPQIRKYVE
jgi:hypothetical protein